MGGRFVAKCKRFNRHSFAFSTNLPPIAGRPFRPAVARRCLLRSCSVPPLLRCFAAISASSVPSRCKITTEATMRTKVATLFVVATATGFAGQAPARVDFRNDVEPVLRSRCYSCHGAEVRMNRLRLDRRADAMRGGLQSDIGPGNAEGSRLYHRLIGTKFGTQ